MKVWSRVTIKDNDKDIELISKSLTNYLYKEGPWQDISKKYNIDSKENSVFFQNTVNRIAGLLMLYASKDTKRINDIVNKYNINTRYINSVSPEIEGYIDK